MLPAAHSQPAAEPAEPPPFRRELLTRPDRLLQEMERVRQGVLVQLPLRDFEERARRATRSADPKSTPRLLEASYRAIFKDNALHGSGQWKAINPDAAPAVLRVQPLNLALRRLRFENRDALLADFAGQSPGLLLDEAGPRSVSLDWTIRGDPTPDGVLFDLRVPPCAVAALEVDLPAGHAISVLPAGCLVSGPHLADDPNLRRWRIGFAGRSQLYLTVRQVQGDGPPPVLLAGLQTTQKLNPDSVEAEFKFDVRVLHQGVRELRVECDPVLRPYEVIAPGLESWELVRPDPPAPAGPPAPPTLRIRLREPILGGTVSVLCLAPLEGPGDAVPPRTATRAARPVTWTSPGAQLSGAVPRGETLLLRFHPDLRAEDWKPGGFRLTRAVTEADGTQVLALSGGGVELEKPPAAPGPRRPSARLQTQEVEYLARQLTTWQARPEKPVAKVEVSYEVTHGRLFELPLALPPGWEVDHVEMNRLGPVPTWSVRGTGGKSTLVVELKQPLTPSARAPELASGGTTGSPRPMVPQLTVHLRPARDSQDAVMDRPGAVIAMPFPDVVPLGARLFEGALAIDFDQQLYDALPETTAPLGPADEEGPWRPQAPDYYYPYRGRGVQGTLRLRLRTPRLRARCSSEVVLTSGRAALATHLFLYPEVGSTDTVDLTFSAPLREPWRWRAGRGNNEVRRFERLPAVEGLPRLGAAGGGPLAAAALLAAPPAGERWRLTFSRPLREPVALHATDELARAAPRGRWEVPLLNVPDASRMDGEVKLFLSGADVVQIEAEGLHEARAPAAASGSRGRAPSPWRTFLYGAPPAALALRGQVLAAARSTEAAADHVFLTTYVEPGGRQLHHYRFQLWNWRQRTVPIRLPAEARLLAARVDGRWAAQLPAAEPGEEGLVVALPAPVPEAADPGAAQGVRHYELLYAVDGADWTVWARLKVDPPGLPVETLAYRHTWCLPPGVVPLFDGRQHSLPGAAAWARGPAAWERLPRSGVPELWRGGGLPFGNDRELHMEQVMEAAGVVLGRTKPATLGELIDRLVFDHLRDQGPLVLDAVALREAGLASETALPAAEATAAPPWERLGLVYVLCPPGPLLTTRRQFESWQLARQTDPLAGPIEAAVAEAAVLGHDSSARFWSATDWLRRGPDGAPADRSQSVFLSFQTEFPWTEWESVAGTQDAATFLVVRQDLVPGLGLALAALLCLAFWRAGRSGDRRRLAFLLLWLAAGGLALLWLPAALQGLAWWPVVAGGVIAFVWYLWSAGRAGLAAAGRPSPEPGGAAAAVAALVCFTGLAGSAAAPTSAPAPPTVFLVPGPADAPEKQTVLAPPELLDQLDALARRQGAAPREVVLVSADYQGEVAGGVAEFRAAFQVYCPSDEPVTLALPLDGVQLPDDILLDGARAYATAAPAPQTGYLLRVKDRGPHTIRLRFRVPVQAAGDERTVRFTGPGLLQNRLTMDLPPGTRFLQAQVGQGPARGAQRVSGDARGLHLEADLGRPSPPQHLTAPVLLRWRQDRKPAERPVVHVREAHLWGLRPDASSLTSVFRCTVSRAPVTELTIHLPDALEVQSVDVPPGGGVPVRLRDWQVVEDKGRRRLRLEFSGPLLGDVQATVQLVPAAPLTTTADLPLPVPLADALPEPTDADFLLAYRQEGVEVGFIDSKLVTRLKPQELFAEQWQKVGRSDPMPPTLAFTFRRRPNETPLLRVRLALPPARVRAVQDVTWRVGPQQAEFRAAARLTAPDEDLAYVEWEVPAVETITSVSGPDLRHWTRVGNRLQIWLQRSLGATEVQLAGWMPLRPGTKGGPAIFALPPLRLATAQTQRTYIRLQAAGDAALTPTELQNLLPLPDPRLSDQELSYVAPQPFYRAVIQVRPAAAAVDVKVLTLVELRERQLVFVARVEYQVRQGELRRAMVRLRNWAGDIEVEAAEPAQSVGRSRGQLEDRTWVVSLPPGVTDRYRLTLTGSIPQEKAAAGIPMPEVTVPRAGHQERWLLVAGNDLTAESPQGLTAVADVERDLKPWPGEANRLRRAGGRVWRVEAGDQGPRLLPRPRAGGPVQVFLTEQTAAVVDGGRWGHEAVWWLYHEANTDLTVSLPEGARAVGVSVDDSPIAPLQPSPRHLWLPLPGGAGVRSVRLRWVYEAEAERLNRPQLARPRLEGAADGPVIWTVRVPAEYQASAAGDAGPMSGAGIDVRRAEALLRISALLAEQGRDQAGAEWQQLAAAQRRFYECCRYAAQGLAASAALMDGDALRRPEINARLEQFQESNQDQAARLEELLRQNRQLAQAHGFEELRARAERQARPGADGVAAAPAFVLLPAPAGAEGEGSGGLRGSALPEEGTPLHWHGEAETAAPRVQLTQAQTGQVRRALAASLLLLVVLLVAWVVAQFPDVLSWVRAFWPEQMALLGCIGWQALGLNAVVVFLILLGVCARLIALGQAAVALLRRWKPAPESPPPA